MSEKPLTIVELKASNVKRLRAVHIRPDGAAVVLGGKNGQGKSSVLDAIAYALGGKDAACREPVRRGAESAEIVCDLGEIIVRRTFKPTGETTLVVSSREGARFPSPQAMLDRLTGSLTFDPLAFARMRPAEQSETLRRLVGLDFKDLDAERASVYAERTTVNRDGQAMLARFNAAPSFPDAPAAEISSSEVLAERDAATERNAANSGKRDEAAYAERIAGERANGAHLASLSVEEADAEVKRWTEVAATRRRSLIEAERMRDEARAKADAIAAEVTTLVDVDLAPFKGRLDAVDATNNKVRANAVRAKLEKDLEAKRDESRALTARLEAIDAEKAKAIETAPMPVPGLGFDAAGVTLNGLPFEQASQAEQLRVSVAMGFALNPRLRVLLVRDASLLDSESLDLVTRMAEEAGAQVWLERVEADAATTVLIEDGQARAVEAVAPAA
jgi:hypothetical protein